MSSEARRPAFDPLNRRGWLLWGLMFSVVIAFTVAVPLLYLPLLEIVQGLDNDAASLQNAYYAVVGLGGLVIVFCLYTVLRQREMNEARRAFEREEAEKNAVRARLSELSALFQVSTTLNLQFRLDVILEIIVRRVVSTLKAQQASIMIYNPETCELETRASYGLESEFARHARAKLGEGIAGWVASRNEPVQLDGKPPDSQHAPHYKRDRNITSALSLPLRVGERCVGVLNVNRINHPEVFREHHRDMLLLFAEHVGAVVDRAEVLERLGSRTRELEADNLRLSESGRLKDVFLSTASHELKTPLTSVIAYAELLDDNESRLSVEQRRQFLGRLRGEAGRLLTLIEDILDLTRLESGKLALKLNRVQPNEIAHTAVETTRNLAARYGVELVERFDDALPRMPLDEVKMRQVLVNLIANAIKFSPEHGTVEVRTGIEGPFLVLSVHDDGAGIRPEETPHIFELFGQGSPDDHAERGGGLGIGLHLVKRITELHGGHVGVNSRPSEGSTFWVRLPLALAAAPSVEEVANEAA